jgi:hypothetical protein
MESLNSTLPSTFNIPVAYLKNYSQQLMKIWGDKTDTLNPSDLLRFKLPNTVIDMKTLNFIFEFTTSAVGTNTQTQNRYFPRLSASILGSVAVYINGVLVDNCQNYNQLFCLLYDAQSASTTSSLRYQEANDPSFKSAVSNTGTITNTIQGNSTGSTDDSDISRQFSIRSWISFLGSLNTSIIDVSKIGEVILEFTMAPTSIIWKGAQPAGGAVASPSVQNYTVKNYYMTVNRISFGDDLYSSYLDNLISTGRYKLTYLSYLTARGSSVVKTTNPTLQLSVNANTMTKIIATCVPSTYTTESLLQNTSQTLTYGEQLTKVNTYPDLFNNSIYFKKDFCGLDTSQIIINSVPQTPFPLKLEQIYSENLNILGSDSDLKATGHPGAYSLASWTKYYAYHLTSFSHRVAGKEDIISGYNSKNSSIQVKWEMFFNSGSTDSVYPTLWVETYRELTIGADRQILLIQ